MKNKQTGEILTAGHPSGRPDIRIVRRDCAEQTASCN